MAYIGKRAASFHFYTTHVLWHASTGRRIQLILDTPLMIPWSYVCPRLTSVLNGEEDVHTKSAIYIDHEQASDITKWLCSSTFYHDCHHWLRFLSTQYAPTLDHSQLLPFSLSRVSAYRLAFYLGRWFGARNCEGHTMDYIEQTFTIIHALENMWLWWCHGRVHKTQYSPIGFNYLVYEEIHSSDVISRLPCLQTISVFTPYQDPKMVSRLIIFIWAPILLYNLLQVLILWSRHCRLALLLRAMLLPMLRNWMSCYTYHALPSEYLHHLFGHLWHLHLRWIKACSFSSLEFEAIHSSTLIALLCSSLWISTSISVS